MDTDKLNEAAEEYAHENAWYPSETSYESDITAMEESFSDTFKQGASWLMWQPLADRLTDEEKEKIKSEYEHNAEMYDLGSVVPATMGTMHKGKVELLESIFGKELFNEK